MTDALILAQIKSLEFQLEVLKAQIKRDAGKQSGIKSFADLYGIFAEAGSFSEEEINAALYTIDEAEFEPENTE